MTRVLIFLTLPEEVRSAYHKRLRDAFPDLDFVLARTFEEACREIASADILYTFGAMVRDELYTHAKKLKWVQALGTGIDNIADAPSLSSGVLITSTRGIHGTPISEAAFLAMLALARDFPRALKAQQARRWERWPAELLAGKTVGILGIGLIAEELAPRAKAFGMTVAGISRTPREVAGIDHFHARDELAAAVRDIDFLILLLPYDAQSHHIIDEQILSAMKPGAYLVNLARGGVVDETALIAALEDGRIAGAALDTFIEEPLPADHPLWQAPNLLLTCHTAGFNARYIDDAIPQFAHNLRCFLAGRPDEMININRTPRGSCG